MNPPDTAAALSGIGIAGWRAQVRPSTEVRTIPATGVPSARLSLPNATNPAFVAPIDQTTVGPPGSASPRTLSRVHVSPSADVHAVHTDP